MFRIIIIFCLVVAASWLPAQTPAVHAPVVPSAAGGREAEKPADSAVLPTEAVITVPGICDSQPAESRPCDTVITREQFENLLKGLNESGQPLGNDQRKALAEAYVNFLAYAAAARKDGIENSPQFREFIIYQQLRVLAGIYKHVLEEKYKISTPEDIKEYYEQHRADFEEVNLRRLMIPKNHPAAKDQEDYKRRALEFAQDAQVRASRGEDLDDLQKEAYQSLGLTISPPATQIGRRRRSGFVTEEAAEIFSLRPGEASKLETEISSYVVYKVESRRTIQVDQVKGEIAQLLFKERVNAALKAVTGSVHPELNPKYFVEPTLPLQNLPQSQASQPQTKF